MYNGIGLTTPRGSGTNGYIQTNKFFVRARPLKSEPREFGEGQGQGGVSRKANKEILEHDRKRQIELKLTELEDELLEQGFGLEEIAEKVEASRKILEAASNEGEVDVSDDVRVTATQTHQVAAKKEKQLDIMKAALGLDDIKEGEAFDRELQEQRKQDRIMVREEKDRERKEKQLELEKEERRREKELRIKEKEELRSKEKELRSREKELRSKEKEELRSKEREPRSREKEEAKQKREEKDHQRTKEKDHLRSKEKEQAKQEREGKDRRREELSPIRKVEDERRATKRRRNDR